MYEQVDVAIDDLLLDHENPRLGSVPAQSDILRELILLNQVHFHTMMLSIKQHGLDPGDLFYLVDESEETGVTGLTVVDGNRRLAALKVLREPGLLAGTGLPDSMIKKLRDAAVGFQPDIVGESRLSILFASRGDAEDWILRRHGRGLKGEERIAWGPLEIQRFQGDFLVLDVFDFVERNGGHTPEQWATVRGELQRRSYVVRRFLESKAGVEALALGTENVDEYLYPTTRYSAAYLVPLLKSLLEDAAAEVIDTRKYNKAAAIEKYFADLKAKLALPTSVAGDSKRLRDLELNRTSTPAPSPPPPPPPTAPPSQIRNTLAPKRLEFREPLNEKGKQFIREATKVQLKSAPLSAAFLLRGFIQFVVDSYMHDNGLPFWEGEKQLDLHVRAERVIDHLIKNKRAKSSDLNGIRRKLSESAKKHHASIQALNDYHHDQYQIPSPDALRSGWDDATALFVAILGRVAK
ncbi:MAG TPA: hypothetical protein VGB59_06130 [Allosphingosinicella sp.]